jgi:hypothetical protein
VAPAARFIAATETACRRRGRWRVTLTARGATSRADVALTMGIVAWLADGAVVRQDNYVEWAECVEALGLDDVAPVASD